MKSDRISKDLGTRRMQWSLDITSEIDLDPCNCTAFPCCLDREIVVEGISIPPYFTVGGYLYERLHLLHRVKKLADNDWRKAQRGIENDQQQTKVPGSEKVELHVEINALQITNRTHEDQGCKMFPIELFRNLPPQNINIFTGLIGDSDKRKLLWHYASGKYNHAKGVLKWVSSIIEGKDWKDVHKLNILLHDFIAAHRKHCPLSEVNAALLTFGLKTVDDMNSAITSIVDAVRRAIT